MGILVIRDDFSSLKGATNIIYGPYRVIYGVMPWYPYESAKLTVLTSSSGK